MKYFLVLALIIASLLSPAVAREKSAAALPALEEQAFKEAAAVVSSSVVRIETVGGVERIGKMLVGTGPTTGVVVAADGYIVTSSFNFASKPSSILVTLPDGRRFTAEQVATDKVKMLTLIKIDADKLTPAPFAPPESFRVGQWAVALGRTYHTPTPSVSVGIVSALHRIWGKAIQTDAKVSPVNYGGPLVDVQGRVLGVLVPLSPEGRTEVAGVEWYDAGIGFAIPMADIYGVLERLKGGKDLSRGLMGIAFKGKDIYGTLPLLDRVRYASPAQKAGLKPGDTIVEINGKPVLRIAQVKHALGSSYAGDQVAVAVRRGEETIRVELKLVAELLPYESAFLGILPARPSLTTAAEGKQPGVGLRYIYPDSPAARVGLKLDDRIVRLNQIDVESASQLRDAVSRIRPEQEIKLTVSNGGKLREETLQLAAIPDFVPEKLPGVILPPSEAEAGKAAPQTGHFTETLEAHEHDLWAFVPDDYNPASQYGLLVWIHPAGDTMEAALLEKWKPICRQRGIILLAPKAEKLAGWTPGEVGFVKSAVESFTKRYAIDRERIVLHSFASGAPLAYHLAVKERELFRGISVAAAPLLSPPPENRPEYRLQWQLICGEKDPVHRLVQASAQRLRTMRYPVTFRSLPDVKHRYPDEANVEAIGLWIDALDRI